MISANSIRFPRPLPVLVVLVNLLTILLILMYFGKAPNDRYANKEALSSGFQSLTNKFAFSYLYQDAASADSYRSSGYQKVPQNVRFQYVNPKNKKGTPEEILKLNEATYSKVLLKEIHEPKDFDIESIRPPADVSGYKHANATIIALVRNNEALAIGRTIRKFEKKFNSKFGYPYTFINDQPFTQNFKKRMQKLSDAPMNFITIPSELWDKPSSIDTEHEHKAMDLMAKHNIAHAKEQSYHNMCRFYSGNLYNVPELKSFKYYWRIEPDVNFYNELNYDVFKYLEGTSKVYGFTINIYDIDETVATLLPETLKFLNQNDNYKYVHPNGSFQWLLENQQNPKKNKVTGGYSTCHFWSNFEIGDMDFFRSEPYMEWFKYLDSTGKFYYERWGDAPVHSMGLALFADKKDIHWFRDIGYFHDPYVNCPNHKDVNGCVTGQFSRWAHLADQNCMANWIDYSMDDLESIY